MKKGVKGLNEPFNTVHLNYQCFSSFYFCTYIFFYIINLLFMAYKLLGIEVWKSCIKNN
jgi:hypothetical protein